MYIWMSITLLECNWFVAVSRVPALVRIYTQDLVLGVPAMYYIAIVSTERKTASEASSGGFGFR